MNLATAPVCQKFRQGSFGSPGSVYQELLLTGIAEPLRNIIYVVQ